MNKISIEKINRKIKQFIIISVDFIIINLLYYFFSNNLLINNLNSFDLLFLSPIIFFYFLGLYNTTFSEFSSYHFFYFIFNINFFILNSFVFLTIEIESFSFYQLFFFSVALFF